MGRILAPAPPRGDSIRFDIVVGVRERSLIQQGTFTVFGSPDKSLEDNLAAYDSAAVTDHVIKLVIPATQRAAALADLDRMNIHRGSLFPGLAGYAQSLAYRLTGRQTLP